MTRFYTSTMAVLAMLFSSSTLGEYALNLPEPVAVLTKEIFDLHMLTTWVALIIMVIITGIILYALFRFRKSTGYEADQKFHEGWFGRWSWLFVPILVLAIDFSIAGSASSTLNKIETYPDADVTVKVIVSQWKWTYEYMEDGLRFNSNLKEHEPDHEFYLRDVDNPLVLPVGKKVRFLHTASDVLHAWWVPSIVYKKDSIPGYINETWAEIEKEGVYRGQCAENCGTGHAYMPIVVKVVSADDYTAWVAAQQEIKLAKAAEASADKVWSMEDLMTRGEAVYNMSCASCHQITGTGIPGAFPGIKGSAIATGPMEGHMDIVMNGKAGTAMAPWKAQLDDLEMAAVITYERNAFDNNKGDLVQPADVKAAR